MQTIKIGIVEDEMIIAENISMLLKELNYSVCKLTGSYDEAITMIENERPDLVLVDINLIHSKDGIEVAKYMRQHYDTPIIFLTANSDKATVDRAKQVNPNAYLIKPFQRADLHVSIEIALHNYNLQKSLSVSRDEKKFSSKPLFVKEGEHFHKVDFNDIAYLSADHVYVTVHTNNKKFLVRSSLQEYMERFDPHKFIRVHRSYVVNVDKIESTSHSHVIVNGETIPVSRNHRDHLLKAINAQ